MWQTPTPPHRPGHRRRPGGGWPGSPGVGGRPTLTTSVPRGGVGSPEAGGPGVARPTPAKGTPGGGRAPVVAVLVIAASKPWDMAGSNPGNDFRCTIGSCVLPIPTVESTITSPY